MSTQETTAVVLAAGEGRRLEPLTNRRPKPMLPVVNRPLLEHVVEAIAAAGIEHIVLVVGYQRDRIQTHFGDGDDWDVDITYAIQEKQLGTAHALSQAEPHVDGDFLVLNGDQIIEPSVVEAVREGLFTDDSTAMLAATRSSQPSIYGVVELDGERVVDIVEKPHDSPSQIVNAGIYGFREGVFDALDRTDPAPDGERKLTDTLRILLDDGTVRPIRYDGRWLDVSQLWDLLSVTDQLLETEGGHVDGQVAPGVRVSDSTLVAETASVGANAVVGNGTTIAANARVGPNATVERSVVFPDATVGAGAVVRDCIVGANATVGANVTASGGDATVVVDGTVYEDVTLGGVVGDNASVGGATVFEPGVVIGDSVDIAPGVTAGGKIPDDATVRRG